jgi:hypothetical protein
MSCGGDLGDLSVTVRKYLNTDSIKTVHERTVSVNSDDTPGSVKAAEFCPPGA